MGTLAVEGVTATGPGVHAQNSGGVARVTADPGALPPGTYNECAVTIECNAVNCPVRVPVRMEIASRAAPVVDNATFLPGASVTPGDVVVAKGDQLSLRAPEFSGVPLAASLGGASVLVNDVAAPICYSSFGQIAFRIPSTTALGTARVQIVRDGIGGNTVSANLVSRAPQILAVTDAGYNPIDSQHPARAGGGLILWAIGLGPTSPLVPDDALPETLAGLTMTPTVQFFGSVERTVQPTFAGLRFPDAVSDPVTVWVR